MPEGPEVKRTVEYLNHELKDQMLVVHTILKGRYLKQIWNGFSEFQQLLPLRVKEISNKGKFIYWTFYGTDFILSNTLGMTGYWSQKKSKHANLEFMFPKGTWYFVDTRNFGTISLKTSTQLLKKLDQLGPDILVETSPDEFISRCRKKRSKKCIAELLLDQKLLSGVGNYLRAEALYIAKIDPFQTLLDLTDDQLGTLYSTVRNIALHFFGITPNAQIQKLYGKASPSDYISISYQTNFLIYGKTIGPKGEMIRKQKLNGRTLWYVI